MNKWVREGSEVIKNASLDKLKLPYFLGFTTMRDWVQSLRAIFRALPGDVQITMELSSRFLE